ncbi:adhesion G-protein coupled receptor G6-like [Centruroides sculpturatus]|uniref:adhesion G-protein coupled receptor G6-like n=1 Tax=Centruroides sculpturatus TaxID=218467 RepID=UPI000C6E9D36|nr:adhesion G-protein coupled receptor G6-like [Centruroides sculpturatus]
MKVEGSGVSWSLDNPEENHFGICQSTVEDSRVSCEIIVVSEGVFKCLCSKSYYKSVTWYKDGVIVNGTRGLTTGGEEYLTVRNLLSTNTSLDRGRLQGYYWCLVDQKRPFVSVASPRILFTFKDVWTFVGEFDSSMDFLRLDPSTKEYFSRCRNIGEKIEKALTSVGQTVVHVHRLSETKDKIKVNFFIYTRSSSKKRETKMDESKEKLLNELQNRMTRSSGLLSELKISPESIRIKITVGCLSTITEVSDRNVTWPRKNFGEIALPLEDCVTDRGDPVVRRCLGNFTYGAYWGPVDGKCRGELSDLTLRLKELSTSDEVNVTKELSNLVNEWPRIRAIDIHYVATCLEKVSTKPNFQNPQESFEEIASTIDNLMKTDSSVLASANTKTNASSRITASLESMLEANNVFINISNENIIIASHPLTSENVEVGILLPLDTNRIKILYEDTLLNDEYRVRIRLPRDVSKEKASSNATFNYVVYQNDAMFFTHRTDRAVVSNVLYARPTGAPVRLPAKRIEIAFRVFTVPGQIPHSSRCVFWDYSANRKMGDWSDLGCEITNRTARRVVCHCDHMTNFAVLVNLHPDYVERKIHAVVLDIFTYVGCALSIMGLVLTLSSFVMFKKLRKGVVSKVLCNLASAILLSLIVFVSGIDQISSEKGCIFAAALLHYSLMASFCWMLIEALQQYLKLVKVLDTYIPKFMLKASVFAWCESSTNYFFN